MSYALDLSANAKRALATLDIDLQEQILDELEMLAADPMRIQPRSGSPSAIYDFTIKQGANLHYIFITLQGDPAARTLQVEAIGHHLRTVT